MEDFYPFGAAFNSYTRENAVPQKYLYQSKELITDLGLNEEDFGPRRYDPWRITTTTQDPHAINYEEVSPYSFINNNPINTTDPTGMDAVFGPTNIASTFVNTKGEIIEHRDDNDRNIYVVEDTQAWIDGGKKKDGLRPIGIENPSYQYTPGQKIDLLDPNQNQLASALGTADPDYTIEGFVIPFFSWLKYLKFGKAGGKLLWGFWDDYAKILYKGREYAKIGSRYYSRHAVDRMAPSAFGKAAGGEIGRSVAPEFVEKVIATGVKTTQVQDGVVRTVYTSGTMSVVTEEAGKIIITIMTK